MNSHMQIQTKTQVMTEGKKQLRLSRTLAKVRICSHEYMNSCKSTYKYFICIHAITDAPSREARTPAEPFAQEQRITLIIPRIAVVPRISLLSLIQRITHFPWITQIPRIRWIAQTAFILARFSDIRFIPERVSEIRFILQRVSEIRFILARVTNIPCIISERTTGTPYISNITNYSRRRLKLSLLCNGLLSVTICQIFINLGITTASMMLLQLI